MRQDPIENNRAYLPQAVRPLREVKRHAVGDYC